MTKKINKSFDEMTNEELAAFIVDERIRCGQWDEDERDYALAHELRGTREALVWSAERLAEWHAEEDAMEEEDEMSDRPFNIDELYDFLGEFVEDFDIQGILDDATECDPINGNRFWKTSALDPDDFQRIVDAHEKTIHEETLENVADAIGTAFRSFRDQLAADASVEEDDDDWYHSDRLSPTEAECEYEKLAEQVGGQISFPFPLTISEETRADYSRPDFTQFLPDVFFHLDPDDEGDRESYERILREVGQKCLFDDCDACMSMSEDEKRALALLNEIWAYNDDEDDAEAFEDSWTEWVVLCGEQEELTFDEDCAPAWVWVPTRRKSDVAGVDHPFLSRDDAIKVFDDMDPFVMWMGRRLDEVASGKEMELDRRFEVELVCQNVSRTADGIESVRDDSVSMSKSFDITHDGKAQRLLKNLFA